MPKRSLNAFQAFCRDSTGKGIGGLSELTKAFAGLVEDEKRRYLTEAEERSKTFRTEMEAFEKSKEGRRYRIMTAQLAKRKRLKDLREKFLKEEPKRPVTAFFHFNGANRAKVAADHPELKGLGPVQGKLSEMWRNLSAEDKQKWLDKEKEEMVVYDKKMEEFHGTDDYKKFKRMSGTILGVNKGKVKSKKKAGPAAVKMPEKPEGLPQAPKNGFAIYSEETRSGGGPTGIREVSTAWVNLGAEGQKKYQEKAEEEKHKYEADMIEFDKTVEGKKYRREKMFAERKQKLMKAKERFLGNAEAPKEPKRPPSSYFIFLGQKSAQRASGDSRPSGDKAKELSKELSAEWNALSPEGKKEYEDKAKELKDKYDEDMKAYKESSHYKNFAKSQDVITGRKAKMVQFDKARKAAVAKAKVAKVAKVAKAPKSQVPKKGAAASGSAAAPKNDDDEMGSDSKSSAKSSSKSSSSSSSSSD